MRPFRAEFFVFKYFTHKNALEPVPSMCVVHYQYVYHKHNNTTMGSVLYRVNALVDLHQKSVSSPVLTRLMSDASPTCALTL